MLTSLVPILLQTDEGEVREPTKSEIEYWADWVRKELSEANPKLVVSLGRLATTYLADEADFSLPHPISVRYSKDHNEIERKADHIIKSLAEITESEAQLDSFFVPIRKMDGEQQKVWGVVLQPNTPDAHGDVMSADEIEKTAHNFLRRSRVIGVGHNRPVNADPVESYIAPVDFQMGDETVLAGSWVMGVQIDDGEQWEKVKAGELTGFSPGGFAQRDPIY